MLLANTGQTQNTFFPNTKHKGKFFFYWGWNHASFTKSNITFKGKDYDFSLKDVIAKDRQSPFSLDLYLNPSKMTIPQYNFRVGYFIKDNWAISLGTDHMKYVVQANQLVEVNGAIENADINYDGIYENDFISLTADFLQLEHTDGLNYIHTELKRFDTILDFGKIAINVSEGIGIGVLLPRTNTVLLGRERHDAFHLSGYGVSAAIALNISFFDRFFINSAWKYGYINMPNIRTTDTPIDTASQVFFFTQYNLTFGGIISL